MSITTYTITIFLSFWSIFGTLWFLGSLKTFEELDKLEKTIWHKPAICLVIFIGGPLTIIFTFCVAIHILIKNIVERIKKVLPKEVKKQ